MWSLLFFIMKSLVIVLDDQIAFLFFSHSHPVVMAGENIAGPVGVV